MKLFFTLRCCTLFIIIAALALPTLSISSNKIVENSVASDEHVVWVKAPIHFVVPTNKQRMLSFPSRVVVKNEDPNLTTDKVSIYNNNGTLYVTAHRSFLPILLPIKLLSSGEVVLIYLSSNANATDNLPLDIVIPSVSKPAYAEPKTVQNPSITINDLSLLRFATQQFSIQRLAKSPGNIHRTPMYTHKTANVYYGDAVIGYPLISWRSGDLYVTAVQLKNITSHDIYLRYKNLKGDWQAACFYRRDKMKTLTRVAVPYNKLTRQGTKRDFTMVFLVSTKPFGQSIDSLSSFVRRGA